MQDKKQTYISYLISTGVHVIGLLLLLLWSFNTEVEEPEYLTIGFGSIGNAAIPGRNVKEVKTEEKEVKQKEEKKEDVKVPKVKNSDEDNVTSEVKEKKEEKTEQKEEQDEIREEQFEDPFGGQGFGIQIDWGGGGLRKIYNYYIPPYPEGVNKEIDLKLRFTIFPDGTVGKIIPLIKADSRLETAAISSLRQWKFEPIPDGKKKANQVVTIIFPFRLK